jgi:hypothetical protein
MTMLFQALGSLCSLVMLVAAIFVYIHAFQKSVGKGFMVLCIPCYILYYLHTEFEHPKKPLITKVFYAGLAGNVVAQVIANVLVRT